jgi:type IV secretory pathway VirB2 component (pilin)
MSRMVGLTKQDTGASASVAGPVSRLRSRVASVLVVIAAVLVGFVSPASAQDLTGGAGDSFFSAITGYIQGPLGIAVLTLFAIITGFAVLMKWGGKVAKK